MPAYDDNELHTSNSPSTLRKMSNMNNGEGNGEGHHDSLAIPGDDANGPQEIPATRSSISEAAKYMHNLSVSPSMRDRRSSRNSFGTALPIPRKRQSRLSSVHHADGRPTRPGMPPIQPTRDLLVAQVQDLQAEKVKKAKNMAFAFDIDGAKTRLPRANWPGRLLEDDQVDGPGVHDGRPSQRTGPNSRAA
jgi:hypothetical protein